MSEPITANDDRNRHCPILGHLVPFAYCRAPASRLPCRRVFDCWWETFDVESFIHAHFDESDVERTLSPGPGKASLLLELIEKARKSADGG